MGEVYPHHTTETIVTACGVMTRTNAALGEPRQSTWLAAFPDFARKILSHVSPIKTLGNRKTYDDFRKIFWNRITMC